MVKTENCSSIDWSCLFLKESACVHLTSRFRSSIRVRELRQRETGWRRSFLIPKHDEKPAAKALHGLMLPDDRRGRREASGGGRWSDERRPRLAASRAVAAIVSLVSLAGHRWSHADVDLLTQSADGLA